MEGTRVRGEGGGLERREEENEGRGVEGGGG